MDRTDDIPSSGFVTTSWVKKRYSISNSTLYNWASTNRIALVKIGPRAVRISVENVRAFEASFKERVARDVKPS